VQVNVARDVIRGRSRPTRTSAFVTNPCPRPGAPRDGTSSLSERTDHTEIRMPGVAGAAHVGRSRPTSPVGGADGEGLGESADGTSFVVEGAAGQTMPGRAERDGGVESEPSGAGLSEEVGGEVDVGNATSLGLARTVMRLAMSRSPAAVAVVLTGSSSSGTLVRTQ